MGASPTAVTGLFAGRYAIERLVGQGATATVHLARDTTRGGLVALKILREELAESAHARRFVKEIRRTSALDHPSILSVLDAGEFEGRPYFVLPYMEGGTLRQRLKREPQLDLRGAAEMLRPIAAALDYASARGLVHRDVKPENILFSGGRAYLGDFGIARVLQSVYGDSTTSANVIRGTPAYMSPEQAAGSDRLDGRSDLFSLACVYYEMVTGMQAYQGPTAESTLQMRFKHPPREINVFRPSAPEALQQALARAFVVAPADRYATCTELIDTIVLAAVAAPTSRRRRTTVVAVAALMVLAAGVATAWVAQSGRLRESAALVPLDTTRFVVFPPAPFDSTAATSDVTELLREAMRWQGYNAVEEFYVRDAMARVPSGVSPDSAAQRVAALLGAGRFFRLGVVPMGDSLRVSVTLYETRRSAPLTTKTVNIDPASIDSAIARLSGALPPARAISAENIKGVVGTTSLPARRAFLQGHALLADWDLTAADSAFSLASATDPRYAQAWLWLAQVRYWQRQPPPQWSFAAEQAVTGAASLSERDRLSAAALSALARGRREDACAQWRRLTELDSHDFSGWFGLGYCLALDDAVVPDGRSRSGWRFRSSYNDALAALERAFVLLPSIHRSFGGRSFEDVRKLFLTSADALRPGHALPPDTTQFLAHPSWQGDTLAFTPLPTQEFNASREWTASPSVNEAIVRQRQRFLQVARSWRAAYPGSADALEAVAVALELLGDATALDSLRAARGLARDRDDRVRISASEVWLRIKLGVPDDLTGLGMAKRLADSMVTLYQPQNGSEAAMLGALAALTGKANLAASYARMSDNRRAPVATASDGAALVAFAAMGGPVDSIHALERALDRAMAGPMTAAERDLVHRSWLVRAASLAAPVHLFEDIASLPARSSRVQLVEALRLHRLQDARSIIDTLRGQRERGGFHAFDISIDGVYPEAAVLAELGDVQGADAWLGATLDSLSFGTAESLSITPRAAALVRAMALRARLAFMRADTASARRWAAPVTVLWRGGDAGVQPVLLEMSRYGAR